jgi:glycosidase
MSLLSSRLSGNTTALGKTLYQDRTEQFLFDLNKLVDTYWDILKKNQVSSSNQTQLSEQDILVITYGDQFKPKAGTPLEGLVEFSNKKLQGLASYIHILPFYPYTSDDGFSVSDYKAVHPTFGTWTPVRALGQRFKLAFDVVLNHTSASHDWFKKFLYQEPGYENYYHHRPKDYDYSQVVRPRVHPLLTPFIRKDGSTIHVWTTFSEDQVDVNFSEPKVMLEFIEILFFYISQGASLIRLDAIAYLWKEDGTSCIHHSQTHNAVKLLRALIDDLHLNTKLLTETNVPHDENISYFGNGQDEAHMVYNFALPPLTLYGFLAGNAEPLSQWAKSLPDPSKGMLFLNFLASHDGVGVTPTKGWLNQEQQHQLVQGVEDRGGRVSWKATATGKVPYELNINYSNGVCPPDGDLATQTNCFLSSQAIMLCLAGIPGIYIHSLIGSENWQEGPEQLGYNRAINRQKLDLDQTLKELDTPGNRRNLMFQGMKQMIQVRRSTQAFSPYGGQEVVDTPKEVFGVRRFVPGQQVYCFTNVSPKACEVSVPSGTYGTLFQNELGDINKPFQHTQGRVIQVNSSIKLSGYETLWIEKIDGA